MKKTTIIATAVLAILFFLALAVYRGHTERELVLKRNGLPLVNMTADVMFGTTSAMTSTDINGKLDISDLPAGVQIQMTLLDGVDSVLNTTLELPKYGSRTIDYRGNRTIVTTKKTYADFIFFKYTEQEVWDWNNTATSPTK